MTLQFFSLDLQLNSPNNTIKTFLDNFQIRPQQGVAGVSFHAFSFLRSLEKWGIEKG